MNRPYSPWLTESVTDRYDRTRADGESSEYSDLEDFDAYADYDDDDDNYDDFDDFGREHDDRRWLWVAGVAGIVLFIALVGTMMILSGGDSGTTSATVSPSTSRPAPYPSEAPSPRAAPSTSAPRAPSATALPPETITSVSPTPTTAPTEAAPPPAAADPRTVTYRVTGSRQFLDLVTVIYTDQQGALQTDVNVALPWTKQVVLDPGVELSSVTATSVAGQLNCTITDAAGATLAAQNNNSMITNCTR